MPSASAAHIHLHDYEPKLDSFRDEVLRGLRRPCKTLPCKLFYDERGSQLFDQICELEEYYLTRADVAIMGEHGPAMAALLGPRCMLIEYGSGSSMKTRMLLEHLDDAAAYVPIDISREHLLHAAQSLALAYPQLEVLPVCADYTQEFTLPTPSSTVSHRVVYFPGSTIGNFEPPEAAEFLTHIAELCGQGGGLLIGVDLKKDRAMLEPAYNDSRGVTAEFNLNVLHRINAELGATIDLNRFRHYAPYNVALGRIEMHLVSTCHQIVNIDGVAIPFRAGEIIVTEYSYKYSLASFAQLAHRAGFQVQRVWTDARGLFSVQYLTVDVG